MTDLEQIEANYAAYLVMCQDKGITPNPETAKAIERIKKLLTPPVQSNAKGH